MNLLSNNILRVHRTFKMFEESFKAIWLLKARFLCCPQLFAQDCNLLKFHVFLAFSKNLFDLLSVAPWG